MREMSNSVYWPEEFSLHVKVAMDSEPQTDTDGTAVSV